MTGSGDFAILREGKNLALDGRLPCEKFPQF